MVRTHTRVFPDGKVCDLVGDAPYLASQYQTLDHYPTLLEGQHPIRRWEYAMALRTIQLWQGAGPCDGPLQIADVGGAGSNWWEILTSVTSEDILIIDPAAPATLDHVGQRDYFCGTLEAYVASGRRLGTFDIVTCLSVIEHLADPLAFFRQMSQILRPGGLLVLSTDYWDAEGPDTTHFHWMRQRIYNRDSIRKLLTDLRKLGYTSFGRADWTYVGPQVYDYSVCAFGVVQGKAAGQ